MWFPLPTKTVKDSRKLLMVCLSDTVCMPWCSSFVTHFWGSFAFPICVFSLHRSELTEVEIWWSLSEIFCFLNVGFVGHFFFWWIVCGSFLVRRCRLLNISIEFKIICFHFYVCWTIFYIWMSTFSAVSFWVLWYSPSNDMVIIILYFLVPNKI